MAHVAAARRTAARLFSVLSHELWPVRQKENERRADSDGPPSVSSFLSNADAVEFSTTPISTNIVLYSILALMGMALIWSIYGTLDKIVVAKGKIITTAPQIVMQPFETAKIVQIHVKAGDRVRKGDALVSFDPAFAQADAGSLNEKVVALVAEEERIEAELDGRAYHAPRDANAAQRSQEALSSARSSQKALEIEAHDQKLRELDTQLAALDTSTEHLSRQADLAADVTKMQQTLFKKKVGSKLQLMAAEKEQIDIEKQRDQSLADRAGLEHSRAQAAAERDAFGQRWDRELQERLVSLRQEKNAAMASLEKAEKLRDFTNLSAPVDAVVLQLADRSVGSVVREAEPLITLVPLKGPMEVEADISSRDVGLVKIGDPARIKLEAYPFQEFGTLQGELVVVSADSVSEKEGRNEVAVFRARIRLEENVGELIKRKIRLGPGLRATSEIKIGQRSIITYLVYPVVRMFDEAMREP